MSRAWYILHTYSGYENKIERTIRTYIDRGVIPLEVIFDIKVPEEEVMENKDGQRKNVKRKFLPGYVLIEMDLPDNGWKRVCASITGITGVSGFLGSHDGSKPHPMSTEEAKGLLQKTGDIKGDKTQRFAQVFSVGQVVKIIDGPFASFNGTIDEVMHERSKLCVLVDIFNRTTPVEVDMSQVENV